MAGISNNWISDTSVVSEKDKRTLERAKQNECIELENGFQWIRLDQRVKILVPCDKNGKPTADGKRKIELFKAHLGIK